MRGYFGVSHNTGGVAITAESKVIFSKAVVLFSSNNIQGNKRHDSIISVDFKSTLSFIKSHVTFKSNHGNLCGGLTANNEALISFSEHSTANFINNYGMSGGALSLYSASLLKISSYNVTILFARNKAQRGGAIFLDDSLYEHDYWKRKPGIVVVGNSTHIKINFDKNKAEIGGNEIFGGWIDWSSKFNNGTIIHTDRFSRLLEFKESSLSAITSDPLRICVCTNGHPDCTITTVQSTVFPGETIEIDVVAVGQNYGTVQALAVAKLQNSNDHVQHRSGSLDEVQAIQRIGTICTTVKYTISSLNNKETLSISVYKSRNDDWNQALFPQEILQQYPKRLGMLFSQLKIVRKIRDCPPFFQVNNSDFTCTCPPLLVSIGLHCDIHELKIIRSNQQWIGIYYDGNGSETIVAHKHCPYNYCRQGIEIVLINQEYQDALCEFNRVGILCGGCKTTFSRVLGSSKCKKCSNLMLSVIIPVDLLAGLLLIIILMVLNLTVSVGTINGLIFYANAIQAQRSAFFTSNISNSFLGYFISWLNLDQGIEMCLYNGLDSYTEVWLQFLFPLYIGVLMVVIIVSSHYSVHISRLSSTNAVQVLATLYLLSYSKLLRMIISVTCYTRITYSDGHTKAVWLYDGNIDYLEGKHITLFVATLILIIILSVP